MEQNRGFSKLKTKTLPFCCTNSDPRNIGTNKQSKFRAVHSWLIKLNSRGFTSGTWTVSPNTKKTAKSKVATSSDKDAQWDFRYQEIGQLEDDRDGMLGGEQEIPGPLPRRLCAASSSGLAFSLRKRATKSTR